MERQDCYDFPYGRQIANVINSSIAVNSQTARKDYVIMTWGYHNLHYQSPLILTELFQHNLINVSYLTACYLYQVMMTLHFLNDVANDAESKQNKKNTS